MLLFALCFVVNAAITFTLAAALARDGRGIADAFGTDTPARRILACVYTAIGMVSLLGLALILAGQSDTARAVGTTLFAVQITYKLLTAWAVGLSNPVVVVNLMVVALLCLTLAVA